MQGAGKGKRVMGGKPQQGDVQMADAGQQQAALPPNAAPSGRIPIPRSQVRLPLEVATHLECRWRDDKYYPARIIERRKADEGGLDAYEYYVHYRKCEWVVLGFCRSCEQCTGFFLVPLGSAFSSSGRSSMRGRHRVEEQRRLQHRRRAGTHSRLGGGRAQAASGPHRSQPSSAPVLAAGSACSQPPHG
jgi:hypothetical protein